MPPSPPTAQVWFGENSWIGEVSGNPGATSIATVLPMIPAVDTDTIQLQQAGTAGDGASRALSTERVMVGELGGSGVEQQDAWRQRVDRRMGNLVRLVLPSTFPHHVLPPWPQQIYPPPPPPFLPRLLLVPLLACMMTCECQTLTHVGCFVRAQETSLGTVSEQLATILQRLDQSQSEVAAAAFAGARATSPIV
eukprot:COSAG05_NODE_1956_length_3789_cov_3.679404_6_plen_194_part_00